MCVGPGVNQLGAHAYTVPCSLHAAFQYMGDAELPGDLAKVACRIGSILHHTRATDNFQIRDLCKIR